MDGNQDCSIGFGNSVGRIAQSLAFTRKIGNRRGSEGLRSFNPSQGTNLLILIILAGDIEMNPGPRFQCRTCKKYCKAAEKAVKCEDCEKRFHASCVNLGPVELQKIESDNDSWYCSNCKAECSLCSGVGYERPCRAELRERPCRARLWTYNCQINSKYQKLMISYDEIDTIAQILKILFIMINLKTIFDGIFLFDWYKS